MLIYDIETTTKIKSDLTTHNIKYFGAYSLKYKKYFFIKTDFENNIKKILKSHSWFIGFNNIEYDNEILKKYHCNIPKYKCLDLLQIIKRREGIIKIGNDQLKDKLINHKLDTVVKIILGVEKLSEKNDAGLNGILKKNNFKSIYDLINKNNITPEEEKIILKYLKRDIDITHKLWKWIESYFESFKPFISEYDIKNYEHIKSSVAVYAYKVICKKANLKETYSHSFEPFEKYEGGYVSEPKYEKIVGKIYCYDFNSLYPSIMIMGNIYNPTKEKLVGWNGGELFKTTQMYNKKNQSGISIAIKELYELRLRYKKQKDHREHAIKIVLNTIYGLLGNKNFKAVCDVVGAGDVTGLARQFIIYASKHFEKNGYEILYNDTDSCYILDKIDNFEKLEKVKDEIIKTIKSEMPFDFKHFNMGLDYKIKAMFFISEFDKKLNRKVFLKKNYAYITEDDKLIIKGFQVKKSNCSFLSKIIFEKYLMNEIIKNKELKFDKQTIHNYMFELFERNKKLAMTKFNLKNSENYKNDTSINYRLSKKYGEGEIFLIPVVKYGIGKGVKYISLKEFNKLGLTFSDLNLQKFYDELSVFIKDIKTDLNVQSISDYF